MPKQATGTNEHKRLLKVAPQIKQFP